MAATKTERKILWPCTKTRTIRYNAAVWLVKITRNSTQNGILVACKGNKNQHRRRRISRSKNQNKRDEWWRYTCRTCISWCGLHLGSSHELSSFFSPVSEDSFNWSHYIYISESYLCLCDLPITHFFFTKLDQYSQWRFTFASKLTCRSNYKWSKRCLLTILFKLFIFINTVTNYFFYHY